MEALSGTELVHREAVATLFVDGVEFLIDADLWFGFQLLRWNLLRTKSGHLYATTFYKGRNRYLHRIVAEAGPGQVADHRDGNTLDCREANLRVTDAKGNARNRAANSGQRFKGVSRKGARWAASITVDRRKIKLGFHDSAESAARAYDIAAGQHFGEFARLNLPEVA